MNELEESLLRHWSMIVITQSAKVVQAVAAKDYHELVNLHHNLRLLIDCVESVGGPARGTAPVVHECLTMVTEALVELDQA